MLRDERAALIANTRTAIKSISDQETQVDNMKKGRNRVPREDWRAYQSRLQQLGNDLASRRERLLWSNRQPSSVSVLYRDIDTNQRVADPDALRTVWESDAFRDHSPSDTWGDWFKHHFAPRLNLNSFPVGSFYIHLTFELHTPYLSRDDNELHILDNPVRKDRVFGCPMIGASSWKGELRAALRDTHQWDEQEPDEDLIHLCGIKLDKESGTGRAGSLYFYPTFFWKTGIDFINPHTRTTKVGTVPIRLETVPPGEKGLFTLLYAPRPGSEADAAGRHLEQVAGALRTLFTIKGIGAKTSSGYGRCEPDVTDGMVVRQGAEDFCFHAFDELVEKAATHAES